ncbi:NADH dehydrogenase [Scopulibacillus darangshiensis]|uniref:NADH dehydrogenase n=1 Tax=Scopulibacillus darangshiensis TaxID=442528 RepID=A0A4R2NXY9_9BACL|nr:NAD(P)/FAD-dependent oxidoreductase [Scopulibacillus darangshiensis]TCP26578.1 NADH dehydrogenase [Scopulibacillus darangshiensis]
MKNLLILGGGYGSMRIMQHLFSGKLPEDLHVTLIDREPYHCMKTEYYALAAGTISDKHVRVAFPEHPQLTIVNNEITGIDLNNKQVLMGNESLSYDKLVIGLGCEDKYHGISGAKEHTLSIQSIRAVRETAQVLQCLPTNSVVSIVGGGLSGIEVASELRESRKDVKIQLFDRGERILSPFPERLSHYVQQWFTENGVDIVNCSNITKVEPGILYNKDEPVETDATVWTAGIQAHHLVRGLEIEKDRNGRAVVTDHHHLSNNPDVFVVGDCAASEHAPSAQLAEIQGDQIYEVLKAGWSGEELPNLSPIKLKGIMGSLGKKKGFALLMGTPVTGRVARLLKSGLLWVYRYHNG